MLHYVAGVACREIVVDIGGRMPAFVEVPAYASLPALYYETGDCRGTYLEISINAETGALFGVSLLAVSKTILGSTKRSYAARETRLELPAFSIGSWPTNGRLRHVAGFDVCLDNAALQLWILPSASIATLFQCGRLRFGCDSNQRLCVIEVMSVSDSEISGLMHYCGGAGT